VRSRAARPVIDRRPQHLPVPLGGMAPAHVARSRRRRRMRVGGPLTVATGAVAGVVGLGLLLAPAPAQVSLRGDHLDVGAMTLTASGPAGAQVMRFSGGASYVLAEHGDGSAVASAAWTAGGTLSSGTCRMRRDGSRLVDECVFASGGALFTSVDVLDPARGAEWQRTYDDGVQATIVVGSNGAAVPVPFPIGR
jgi:hypothetical protein